MAEQVWRGHEPNDIDPRAIVRVWLVLALTILAAAAICYGLFSHFSIQRQPLGTGQAPLPVTQFPQPRLQSDPSADLRALRAEKERLLNSYGRIDEQTVRIPIARAMQLLAERQALGAKAKGAGQ